MSEPKGDPRGAGGIYLVRHAHAIDRGRWGDDDALRPLSRLGRAQAEVLAERLGPLRAGRILSSPALRCAQTVAPLATQAGLSVEQVPFLAEGTPAEPALAGLIGAAGSFPLVACTHGDVLALVLDHLARQGTEFCSPRLVPKAGTWELVLDGEHIAAARLIPAPAIAR
ncbi:MAG: phosphoglycerate mutase family protein [Actinomycetota bacterium]|nr:phosphoglycerate mutase family protein [Actinomycetota bacterium]